MRAQVMLPDGCIRLEPGGQARCRIVVRNLGLTADRFTFEVVGAAASWTTLDPPVLVLGPEATGQVAAYFHPPRAAHIRAGSIPFGVLTTSVKEIAGTREVAGPVVEQLLELGHFTDTILELIPRCVRRSSARYQLTVTNRGNTTLRANLRGRDPTGMLRVECIPAKLTVFPGMRAQSGIWVRPMRRRWRGSPIGRPFQIVVDPGEDIPLVAVGELIEYPILPA